MTAVVPSPAHLYDHKHDGYFSSERHDVDRVLPARMERVLEVGCGDGSTLARLRATHGTVWAAGVEFYPPAAAAARRHLDALWEGDVEALELPVAPGSLDAVLCLDVLEHLRDPWTVAARLAALLRPGGALVVSLPNAQHYSLVLPLLFGRLPFEGSGLRDRTHLHPFVRHTAVELLEGAWLRVDAMHRRMGRVTSLAHRVTVGAFAGLLTYQYVLRGTKPGG